MKSLNFVFLLHEPQGFKDYKFFDIGIDHYYYDDYANEQAIQNLCEKCYLPANRTMAEIIRDTKGKFKVSFAISGLMLEKLEVSSPEVIESFAELAKSGCVEFLAMPYSYSLASLYDEDEFEKQLKRQAAKIEQLFGYKPTTVFNTAMIYSDQIGEKIADLGFRTTIIEGAKHVMGWKSPRFVYSHSYLKNLKLLVRDSRLSDDLNYRFSDRSWSEHPLTAEKFIDWIAATPENETAFNVMMGYEALGIRNRAESGIFEFFKALPYFCIKNNIAFATPQEVADTYKVFEPLPVVYPTSWLGGEKNTNDYNGNELQAEALEKLYSIANRVNMSQNTILLHDWYRLQDADNFYKMSEAYFSSGGGRYDSIYQAFTNYMNILSDFMDRVNAQFPSSVDDEELNSLLTTIRNQNDEINALNAKVQSLKQSLKEAIKR